MGHERGSKVAPRYDNRALAPDSKFPAQASCKPMHKGLNNQPEGEEPNNGKQQSFPLGQDNCSECRQDSHLDGSYAATPQMFVVM
jgi:hypothetical protein